LDINRYVRATKLKYAICVKITLFLSDIYILSSTSFQTLKISSELLKNLHSLGYQQMTKVQAESLPSIIAGKDVLAQAKTGSGKTAAFGLGLLHHLDVKRFRVQSLVLCPTRELADQVAKELRRLARSIHNIKILTLCGGMPFGPQIGSLEHGAHIVVGTPGRIDEHLRKNNLVLTDLKNLVLDEADRMLDMGFQETLNNILSYAPKQKQCLLFSATYPDGIKDIGKKLLNNPEHIVVESTHSTNTIEQRFYKLDEHKHRLNALRLLLKTHVRESTVVFCTTKKETQEIADALKEDGLFASALHGDLEQKQRDQTLVLFSNKSTAILVATDVAARGLDIDNLDLVINHQLPRDSETYVHRIGRTGRAGKKGLAMSLVVDHDDYKKRLIDEYFEKDTPYNDLPSWKDLDKSVDKPLMVTLQIDGGRKQKVRPGDILGALTAQNGIAGSEVGKIDIFDSSAYVAVRRSASKAALKQLGQKNMKGRSFRVRRIR